jgi:PKD repeat protein
MNDTCIKYYYKVGSNNGTITTLTGRLATHEFTSNGTYQVCLWLKNTCANCDTMICKTVVVNCTTTKKCNWNTPYFTYSRSSVDSCLYTFEAKNLNNPCITYKWYFGDSSNTTILTGRLVQHKFGESGLQHIYLILNDTCNDCDTFVHKEMYMNCWGVNTKNLNNHKTQIYPNPVHQSFNIETNGEAKIVIIDALGREMGQFTKKETTLTIDCEKWSPGIYFIHLNNGNSTEKLKIVKP